MSPKHYLCSLLRAAFFLLPAAFTPTLVVACTQGQLIVQLGSQNVPVYAPNPLEIPSVKSLNVPTLREGDEHSLKALLCDQGRAVDITLGQLLVSAKDSYGMLSVKREPPSVRVRPASEWDHQSNGRTANENHLAMLFFGYVVPSTNQKVAVVGPIRVVR